MGDVIDFDEYRKRRVRQDARKRESKSGRFGHDPKREHRAPLPEPASRDDDDADGTDDKRAE